MIDHLGLKVTNLTRSKAFYAAALAPLGYGIVMDGPYGTGFGEGRKPSLWLMEAPPFDGIHVALAARDRAAVDAFYAAAVAAGGRDNGPPGIRAHYHPNYYGAFVLDPDGYNLEAVCHSPPTA